jgi:hypothetical protein
MVLIKNLFKIFIFKLLTRWVKLVFNADFHRFKEFFLQKKQ